MLDTTTFIGLDVHARSIKAVSLDVMTGEVRAATFGYDAGAVAEWVRSVDPRARCVYESGVTGFDLQKRLSGLGVDCVVGAVSKMIKPSADRRRKNDRNDAEFLARMLSVGTEGPRQGSGPGPGRPEACRQGRAEAGREAGGAARARGPRQQGERGHGARARLLGMGGRPHGRGGVGGRSPAHKPVTPEAVRSEAVEANLRSLFCERPGRHTRAQTVGST